MNVDFTHPENKTKYFQELEILLCIRSSMQNILKVKSCLTWSTLDERKNCMSKKSNCKRKNQFGKWFPEMWACASFYIWSGSRVLLSFWGGFAKSLSNPAPKAKKTYIFCGRESRFISAMFYVCQLRVFCWLVFKRHESYNGKFIFGYTLPPQQRGSHTTSWSHFCAGKASRQRAMGYISTSTGPECRFLPSTLYKTEV